MMSGPGSFSTLIHVQALVIGPGRRWRYPMTRRVPTQDVLEDITHAR